MDHPLLRYILYVLLYIPLEILAILMLVNFIIYKLVVSSLNTYYYLAQRNMRRQGLPYARVVSSLDKFLYCMESPSNLSYNTLVCRLGGRANMEECKAIILDKMLTGLDEKGEALFPRLRQVIKEGCLISTWEYPGEFNIDNHVSEVGVDLAMEGSVEKFVGEIESWPLAANKPQWHLYFLSDPNVEDNSYIVCRFHHSICDGISVWKGIMNICDMDDTEEMGANKLVITQLTAFQRRLAMFTTFLCIPIYLISYMIHWFEYKREYINGISGEKRVAWTNKLDFEKIREIKGKTKTTVNDVVMTLLTEATRRYFIRHSRDDVINREVVYGMGVALEANMDDRKLSNKVAGILIRTPTNIEGPFNQLQRINENMNRMKKEMWPFFMNISLILTMALPMPSSLKSKLTGYLTIAIGLYSNLPGPSSTLLLNGIRIEETYGIVMTSWEESIGIAFVTYKGRMHAALKTDVALIDEPKELVQDIEQVLEDMYNEIQ